MTLPRQTKPQGFTLVELTVVLLIVALLTGGMLATLSTNREISNANDTQKQLLAVQDAILGFAAAQGRLPCPATANSNGIERFCQENGSSLNCTEHTTQPPPTHGRCMSPYVGFVPAATLGLSPATSTGLLSDAWGNPIRYAVTQTNIGTNFPFTADPATAGIKAAWGSIPPDPDLVVCSSSANITNAGIGPHPAATPHSDCLVDRLTNKAVAVILSHGANGSNAPTSGNELANWTSSNDRVFVSRSHDSTTDDLVVWVSPNTLYNRLISAGRLP